MPDLTSPIKRKYEKTRLPDSILTASPKQLSKFATELAPQFVALWNGCDSLTQFCALLSLDPAAAQRKASDLRLLGAELKPLRPSESVEQQAQAAVFAAAWNAAADAGTAAKVLGLPVQAARFRANKLRLQGVQLQVFEAAPPRKRRTSGYASSIEAFIAIWNAASSAREAAVAAGIPYGTACSRACLLRKAGHNLRVFASPRAATAAHVRNLAAGHQRFMAMWNASATLEDAASRTGSSARTALQTARRLRKKGLELKELVRTEASPNTPVRAPDGFAALSESDKAESGTGESGRTDSGAAEPVRPPV